MFLSQMGTKQCRYTEIFNLNYNKYVSLQILKMKTKCYATAVLLHMNYQSLDLVFSVK